MLKSLKIVLFFFFSADFFAAPVAFEITDKVWGR
jgi:hypothetical protein